MPLWLLGIGGWLKSALSAALGWMRANPSLAVIIALCALSAWLWHGRNVARSDLAQHIAAEKAATGAQKAVNAAATKHYEVKANEADTKHTDMVAAAFDATAAYVASHRVQPADRTCKAPAPAASGDPSVPPEVPAHSVVAVEDVDVQRCTDATVYAVGAHDWAQSLKLPEDLVPTP